MKFLLNGHLPADFDPSTQDPEVGQRIHALNAEMEAAGALFFACGLYPPVLAKTVSSPSAGKVIVTDGPFLETKEHVGGFMIIEAESMEAALEWAQKGTLATGMPIEVRQIFFDEG